MQDFQRKGGGGGGGGGAEEGGESFPGLFVENQATQLIEEDEEEGLQAANIVIDKDNNVKY